MNESGLLPTDIDTDEAICQEAHSANCDDSAIDLVTKAGQAPLFDVLELLEQLNARTELLTKQGREHLDELKEIRLESHVLTEMHDQCRALREECYERETLGPVLNALIGLADRCLGVTRQLQSILKSLGAGAIEASFVLRLVLEERKADLAEIHALLATFAVEPFQCDKDRFDPSIQQIVERRAAENPSTIGIIAGRITYGYRRNGKVIRRERVRVLVSSDSTLLQ